MKAIKWILAVIVGFALTACHKSDEPEQPARRTVLVYMQARNSLNGYDLDDLQEMQQATIPADCHLLVYLSSYNSDDQLFELTKEGRNVLKTYPEGSSLSVERMRQVIADARAAAPSRELGIVLWSHSSGWRQNATRMQAMTRGFGLEGSKFMSVTELAEALANNDLDYIYFDTCYMGTVEVAYELRQCANFMVGSVCEVPADGSPYQLTLEGLFAADIRAGLRDAIDKTASYYSGRTGSYCPSTLSLIDLGKMDALAAATKAIYDNPQELPADFTPQAYSVSVGFRDMFFDFGQYVETVASDPVTLATWKESMADAMLHERHSPMIWGSLPITHCSGLSTFIPSRAQNPDMYGYQSLAWAKYMNQL